MFKLKMMMISLLTVVVLMSCHTVVAKSYSPEIGETLKYDVYVKTIIHGATQTVTVMSEEDYQGRKVYRIVSKMNTLGLVNKLTSYSENEVLLLDADHLCPLYLKKTVIDKKEAEVEEVIFDYENKKAQRKYTLNAEKTEVKEIELPGRIQDGLSLLYYLRSKTSKSKSETIYFYNNGKVKEINCTYKANPDSAVSLECGEFPNTFKATGDELVVTLDVDSPKYPLLVAKMAKFGNVEMKLFSHSK